MFTTKIKSVALLATLFCAFATFTACDDNHEHDDPKPEDTSITISTPTEGTIIKQGETLHINGTITSPAELHGYSVTVRKTDNDSIVFLNQVDDHAKDFTVHEHWQNNTALTADMEVEIAATINHDGTQISKKVAFKVQP